MITLHGCRSSRSTRMIQRQKGDSGHDQGLRVRLDLLLLQAGDLRFEVGNAFLQLYAGRPQSDRCVRS